MTKVLTAIAACLLVAAPAAARDGSDRSLGDAVQGLTSTLANLNYQAQDRRFQQSMEDFDATWEQQRRALQAEYGIGTLAYQRAAEGYLNESLDKLKANQTRVKKRTYGRILERYRRDQAKAIKEVPAVVIALRLDELAALDEQGRGLDPELYDQIVAASDEDYEASNLLLRSSVEMDIALDRAAEESKTQEQFQAAAQEVFKNHRPLVESENESVQRAIDHQASVFTQRKAYYSSLYHDDEEVRKELRSSDLAGYAKYARAYVQAQFGLNAEDRATLMKGILDYLQTRWLEERDEFVRMAIAMIEGDLSELAPGRSPQRVGDPRTDGPETLH